MKREAEKVILALAEKIAFLESHLWKRTWWNCQRLGKNSTLYSILKQDVFSILRKAFTMNMEINVANSLQKPLNQSPMRILFCLLRLRRANLYKKRTRSRHKSMPFIQSCTTSLRHINLQRLGEIENPSCENILRRVVCLPYLQLSDSLESPISEEELLGAIRTLKPGKSPGPDGFTAHYYKTFIDILKTPLLRALEYIRTSSSASTSFTTAYVTLIPKPAKDLTDCTSYRPISLLNLDLKILAARLTSFLPKLIGPERVGFMPGREAWDNVIKALNLVHYAHTRGIEGLLLSTDAEKAFDRVAWDYLFATCRHIGLGPHMMAWIAALYYKQRAQLKINGSLSEAVIRTFYSHC